MKVHTLHACKLLGWLLFKPATAYLRGHEGEVAMIGHGLRSYGAGAARVHDQSCDDGILIVGEGVEVDRLRTCGLTPKSDEGWVSPEFRNVVFHPLDTGSCQDELKS